MMLTFLNDKCLCFRKWCGPKASLTKLLLYLLHSFGKFLQIYMGDYHNVRQIERIKEDFRYNCEVFH